MIIAISKINDMEKPDSIDPDLLRTFVHIAETGGFTRAATLVGRTQSAVSMQMNRLETLLGHRLLERGKGGSVRLTAHGNRLLGRAREMLAINDAIWSDFRRNAAPDVHLPDDYALPVNAQRAVFTTQLMITLLTTEKFSEAYALVMRHVEMNTPIDPTDISPKDDEMIMSLLSMIEYISINFLSNQLDRDVILRQRKSGLLRTYEMLQDYIVYKRRAWGRPNAYRSFETLVHDFILKDAGGAPSGTP